MVEAKLDEAQVELGWAAFAAKISGALIWLVADAVAATVLASAQSGQWEHALAGTWLMVTAIIWMAVSFQQLRRSDEFNQNLLAMSINSGTLWVVLSGPLFVCIIAVANALRGPPANLTLVGYTLLLIQPPLALFYGVSMAQFARWTYGRQGQA